MKNVKWEKQYYYKYKYNSVATLYIVTSILSLHIYTLYIVTSILSLLVGLLAALLAALLAVVLVAALLVALMPALIHMAFIMVLPVGSVCVAMYAYILERQVCMYRFHMYD